MRRAQPALHPNAVVCTTHLGSLVLRQLGRRHPVRRVVVKTWRVRRHLSHRLRVRVHRRMGGSSTSRESALLRLIMRECYGRVLLVRRPRVITRTVRHLSGMARLMMMAVRTGRSAGGVIRGRRRAVGDLLAIHGAAAAVLAGAADELFRIPITLRASCFAIRQIVAGNVLPL